MTDQRLELIVAGLLRAGVVMAAAVVLGGGVWYLAAHGFQVPDYGHFRPHAAGLRSLSSMPPPEAAIFAGLLLLIATPVARVVFTLAAFAARRDRTYIVITALVLGILLYSIGTSWL